MQIPKTIKYLTIGRKIDLHDKGMPRRTWLHVSDTAAAIMKIIESGVKNNIYNIFHHKYFHSILVLTQTHCLLYLKEQFSNVLWLAVKLYGLLGTPERSR